MRERDSSPAIRRHNQPSVGMWRVDRGTRPHPPPPTRRPHRVTRTRKPQRERHRTLRQKPPPVEERERAGEAEIGGLARVEVIGAEVEIEGATYFSRRQPADNARGFRSAFRWRTNTNEPVRRLCIPKLTRTPLCLVGFGPRVGGCAASADATARYVTLCRQTRTSGVQGWFSCSESAVWVILARSGSVGPGKEQVGL
jgi:hypothetical protein